MPELKAPVKTDETRAGTDPRGQFERFLQANRKILTYAAAGLLVIIGGVLVYNYFYLSPLEAEAEKNIFKAQRQFETDSLNMAMKGDGSQYGLGLEDIADEYGPTKTGELAELYLGLALLEQGKYQEAIDELEGYKTSSKLVGPIALGAIGDAYAQLKNYEEAASYYQKAAEKDDNNLTAPRYYRKAGLAYEKIGKPEKAVDMYRQVKENYPQSDEAGVIDKYLGRAEGQIKG